MVRSCASPCAPYTADKRQQNSDIVTVTRDRQGGQADGNESDGSDEQRSDIRQRVGEVARGSRRRRRATAKRTVGRNAGNRTGPARTFARGSAKKAAEMRSKGLADCGGERHPQRSPGGGGDDECDHDEAGAEFGGKQQAGLALREQHPVGDISDRPESACQAEGAKQRDGLLPAIAEDYGDQPVTGAGRECQHRQQ